MHELSLCQQLKKLIEQSLEDKPKKKVIRVNVTIGELTCIDASALSFCFPSVMKGTVADNAELILTKQPALAACKYCGRHVRIKRLFEGCPHCKTYTLNVLQGQECDLTTIEVV